MQSADKKKTRYENKTNRFHYIYHSGGSSSIVVVVVVVVVVLTKNRKQ